VPHGENPRQYFRFTRVEMTDPLWIDVQRLRYEVYCVELKFLAVADYPANLESDEFDADSVHFAALDHDQGVVATLRLVRDAGRGFPLERHAVSLHQSFYDLPRDKTVEISRLILAGRYRRRAHDARYGTDVGAGETAAGRESSRPQRRSRYPLVLFGLFGCLFEESVRSGLEYWVAAMEPSLQTFLARFGFRFEPVGDPIDYYGEVVPYAARIRDVFETVTTGHPDVLAMVLGKTQAT
jgi:N-acyl amino acid synthase of PEP-CTERM/exosortase system